MLATKEVVAKLAIVAVGVLIVMKVVGSVLTGSIAITADAAHSAIDLLGAVIGYIGVRISGRPPDERHAFGHGKAENIASVVIAGLIFVAAGTIFYQAVHRLISGVTVHMVTVGIYITAAAIVINAIISWRALRVARATESLALEATARDLFADMLSSCAVLVGLVVVRLTGLAILDPIVALLVSIVIARTAYLTVKRSFGGLMDTRLPREEEEKISDCIREYSGRVVSFHALRSRQAGSYRFVDLHLVMSKSASVEEAHRICDELEQNIKKRLPNSSVTIHVEPCSEECSQCPVSTDQCDRKT